MAARFHPDKAIIDKLGGPTAVSSALGYSVDAVKKWGQKGRPIPWRWRTKVMALAVKHSIRLPSNFAEQRAAA